MSEKQSNKEGLFKFWKNTAAQTAKQSSVTPPDKKPKAWVDVARRTSSMRSNSGKDWKSPILVPVSSTSCSEESSMRREDDILRLSIDEYPRLLEISLLRSCVSCNTCVSLPAFASSSFFRVFALLAFNFSRWFPRSKIIFHSLPDSIERWKNELIQVGFSESEVSTMTKMTEVKSKSFDMTRVLVSTSIAVCIRFVETSETDVSLCALQFGNSQSTTKVKPLIAALSSKNKQFRLVVSTLSIRSGSRKTAAISQRQQMVTSLTLSAWQQPSEVEPIFRTSVVQPKIEAVYWSENELSAVHRECLEQWTKVTEKNIQLLASNGQLPSAYLRKLLWLPWNDIEISDEDNLSLRWARFYSEVFNILLFDGIQPACEHLQDAFKDDRLRFEDLPQAASDSLLQAVSKQPSDTEHVKTKKLSDVVTSLMRSGCSRGVIIASSAHCTRDVAMQLSTLCDYTILRVCGDASTCSSQQIINCSIDQAIMHMQRPPSCICIIDARLSVSFNLLDSLVRCDRLDFIIAVDRKSIVYVPKYTGHYMALLHEEYERLRDSDGVSEEEAAIAKNEKMGAVDRYSFKFEVSSLRIVAKELRVAYYVTMREDDETTRFRRFELTNCEHQDYLTRTTGFDFARRQPRKRFLLLTEPSAKVDELDDMQILWNEHVQYLGEISPSRQSARLASLLRDDPLPRCHRRFLYASYRIDSKSVNFINKLVSNIDLIL